MQYWIVSPCRYLTEAITSTRACNVADEKAAEMSRTFDDNPGLTPADMGYEGVATSKKDTALLLKSTYSDAPGCVRGLVLFLCALSSFLIAPIVLRSRLKLLLFLHTRLRQRGCDLLQFLHQVSSSPWRQNQSARRIETPGNLPVRARFVDARYCEFDS
jgi:hypothetical protein